MERRVLGKIMQQSSAEEMRAIALKHGALVDGRIDLRGEGVRFNHRDLDLGIFLLEGASLGASRFLNCYGVAVSFRGCTLKEAWFETTPGKKASLAGAVFDDAQLSDTTLGPRTLDLTGASFRSAQLRNVTFRMGRLEGSCFQGADLRDVYFRSALLAGADFRTAHLCRVSFEKADLDRVSFEGARMEQMGFWGHSDLEVQGEPIN